ncbi:hypothetical protein [Ferrovibrio sp.]|uniref:hypothetical protein n=1 Tax=Ferrovibrio sp. TaxID=1917215 RepID=UPI003D269EBE
MQRGAALVLSVAAALLPTISASAQGRPPIVTDDAQACVTVANLTQYNWPIRIKREGRVHSTVNSKPREVTRYCAPDRLGSGEFIYVILLSSWLPLGECKLRNRGTMEIFREPSTETDSGEVTRIKCYEGR